MKSYMFTFFIILISLSVSAQTLEDIIKKHLEAMGHEQLLEKNSIISRGKIVQGENEIPFISYNKRPNKFRMDGAIYEYTFIQAFDGEIGWVLNPMMGINSPQELPPSEVANLRFQSDFDGFFHNYKEKDHTLKYIGIEEVFGLDTYVILLTKASGDSMHIYIDAENYQTLKTRAKASVGNEIKYIENIFSNYQSIDGILSAYDVETQVEGQTLSQLIYESYDYTTEIPDSIFTMQIDETEEVPAEEPDSSHYQNDD